MAPPTRRRNSETMPWELTLEKRVKKDQRNVKISNKIDGDNHKNDGENNERMNSR